MEATPQPETIQTGDPPFQDAAMMLLNLARPRPETNQTGNPPPVMSVQALEKRRNAEKVRKRTQKRRADTQLKKFKETCPRTESGKIERRAFVSRKTKEDAAYAAYVRLVLKLKEAPKDFQKQNEIMVQSGTVRWREHLTISFVPAEAHQPTREERVFVMQIMPDASRPGSDTLWKDLLQVKASRLKTKHAGLGLARGPMDKKFPPFLGAHMANDPCWISSEDGVSQKEMARLVNCRFDADFTMVASRDTEEDQDTAFCRTLMELVPHLWLPPATGNTDGRAISGCWPRHTCFKWESTDRDRWS